MQCLVKLLLLGVKPGGLTTTTQIRILLCYVIRTVAHPLSRSELEQAMLEKELINYFELADGLSDLEQQELVTVGKRPLPHHRKRTPCG